MKKKFKVNEHASGYSVTEIETGKNHWLSDGVDCLYTRTGKPMRPGSEYFRRALERYLNATPDETREAYFPN